MKEFFQICLRKSLLFLLTLFHILLILNQTLFLFLHINLSFYIIDQRMRRSQILMLMHRNKIALFRRLLLKPLLTLSLMMKSIMYVHIRFFRGINILQEITASIGRSFRKSFKLFYQCPIIIDPWIRIRISRITLSLHWNE